MTINTTLATWRGRIKPSSVRAVAPQYNVVHRPDRKRRRTMHTVVELHLETPVGSAKTFWFTCSKGASPRQTLRSIAKALNKVCCFQTWKLQPDQVVADYEGPKGVWTAVKILTIGGESPALS